MKYSLKGRRNCLIKEESYTYISVGNGFLRKMMCIKLYLPCHLASTGQSLAAASLQV